MGGDPTPERFIAYAEAVASQSDMLEIGIPFSDPIADGPTIQAASVRALSSGTTVRGVLEACNRISPTVPVVIMCYYNTVFRFGEQPFVQWLSAAGVSGLIVPDLPFDLASSLRRHCLKHHIDLIFLASPATREERARMIAARTSGFLYLVSRYGVTGERGELQQGTVELLSRYRAIARTPVAVGFGISTPDQVHALSAVGADGVIVGSAIVSRIGSSAEPSEVSGFVSELRRSTVRDR